MENSLNIALQEAYATLEKFEGKFDAIDQKILAVSKNARSMGSVDPDAISPKVLNERLKEQKNTNDLLNKALEQQAALEKELVVEVAKKITSLKEEQKAQINLATILKKKEIALSDLGKQQQKQRLETQIINKDAKDSAKITSSLTTEYEKQSAILNKLRKEYKDLATQQALGNELTEDQVTEMKRLESEVIRLDGVLKKVDYTSGQFNRNVGNYKSGFDGLGFSIAQLTREAPAFANSMQTGLMAISNNIPMLVDEINKIKTANQALNATGQKGTSVFGALGKAFFSWNTLISVSVTALTVLGPKVWEWIKGLNASEKALEEEAKQIEENNKQLRENIALREKTLKNISNVLNSVEVSDKLFETLNAGIFESSEKEAVLVELAERFNKASIEGADSLKDTNIIQADRIIMANNMLEIAKLQNKLDAERNRLDNEILKKQSILERFRKGEITSAQKKAELINLGNTSLNDTVKIQERILQLQEANNQISEKGVEIKSKSKDTTESESNILKGSLAYYEQIISKLEEQRHTTARNTNEWENITNKINEAKWALDEYRRLLGIDMIPSGEINFNKSPLSDWNPNDQAEQELFDETVKRYEEDLKNYKLYASEKEKLTQQLYNNIGDLALSTIQGIFDAEIQKYDDRIDANNDFYDKLLQNEEITEKQREALEEERDLKNKELERKRKETERKAFIVSQLAALAQVAIDTAIGVTKYLSNPVTAPLVPLVISNGALQAGIIAAQTIPQFKEGHLEGNYEGFALVNDAPSSNYREIIERRNGMIEMFDGRNQVIEMEKGDRVHKAGTFDPSKLLQNGLALSVLDNENKLAIAQIQMLNQNKIISKEIGRYFEKAIKKMPQANFIAPTAKEIGKEAAKAMYLEIQANKA